MPRKKRQSTAGDKKKDDKKSNHPHITDSQKTPARNVKKLSNTPFNPAFPIVGIGASAGGLDAFKKFFSHLPSDPGIAFVLIPHLDPTHESLMVELLAKQTQMKVCEAQDGMSIQPNCVYIIPPNKYLAIKDRRLQLSVPSERRWQQTAIDFCFRSLAEDLQEKAIAIIFSGTGNHGTVGIKEVKLVGGMVMVQEPKSAEYDQMPQSAIATGQVDYILPPDRMPNALLKYVKQPYLNHTEEHPAAKAPPDQLHRILAVLRTRTKYDFLCYRKNMLMRRVQRRMGLCHIQKMSEYLEFLRENPDEVTALYKDLLIGVTSFFREPEAFHVLKQRVIPEFIERTDTDFSSVRVWVPGCATGEEAYSIAMMLIEGFTSAKKQPNLQIFATDIDEDSLQTARLGIYPESTVVTLSPDLCKRFFIKTDEHHFQVNKQLRESVVFAPQNLISDAPFSKLDLVSCRNLLIYLEPELQAKVIRLFHFALLSDGYLVLGPSESIGRQVDLFEPISKKWRIFRRIGPVRRELVDIPIIPSDERRNSVPRAEPIPVPSIDPKELIQKTVLADYAPAIVLINRKYEIISVIGPLVNYLEFPPGEITRNLLSMARQGLRTKIRAAVHKAIRDCQTTTEPAARVKRNGSYYLCKITVKPVIEPKEAEGWLLVTFEDRPESTEILLKQPEKEEESAIIKQLENELKTSREDQQSTTEEMESANEELKASNEEVMSMNEELQSANEELETSKEELQSLNEELSTVNNQLQDKVEELDKTNNDITNLLESTDIATIFLDAEMRIRRFTPATAKLLNLIATDVGRPITDFSSRIANENLDSDAQRVLETLGPSEKEVSTESGEYYLRRIVPYRTGDNRIKGVVITFVEITQRVAAEAESRRFAAVLRDSNDAVTMHNFDGKIIAWNRGAEHIYGYTEGEACNMNIFDLVPPNKRDEAVKLTQRIAEGEAIHSFDTQRLTKDGRTLNVWLSLTCLVDETGKAVAIATTERDITDRKRTDEWHGQILRLQRMVEHLPAGAVYVEDDQIEMNCTAEELTGYKREEIQTRDQWFEILHSDRKQEDRQIYDEHRRLGFPSIRTSTVKRKGGQKRVFEFFAHRFDNHEIWLFFDITKRMQAEKALQTSEERLQCIVDSIIEAIITIDHSGKIQSFNSSAEQIFGYSADEIIGKNVSLLMPSPHHEIHDNYIQNYLKTGEKKIIGTAARELEAKRKDGSVFPMELSVTELEHLSLFTGVIRDLSERKKAEKDLENAKDDLMMQTLFTQRLSALATMAGGIAHELNQPLSSIGLYAETIRNIIKSRETVDTSKVSGNLNEISKQVGRASQIIDHMREFASENKKTSNNKIDMLQAIENVLSLIGQQLRNHRIDLSIEVQQGLKIRIDETRLEQVLVILISNAKDSIDSKTYSDTENGFIRFSSMKDKQSIILRIQDNGSGIQEDVRNRIFEPFVTTKGPQKGSGLGLSICHGILKDYNATIEIEKTSNTGTTFKLIFPRGNSKTPKK